MAAVSGLIINSSGVNYSKLPFQNHNRSKYGFNKSRNGLRLLITRIPGVRIQYHLRRHSATKCFASARGNYHNSSFNRNSDLVPFWSNMMKESTRAFRTLLVFLIEQPSQLKYIEWPTF